VKKQRLPENNLVFMEREFERLKRILNVGHELKLNWIPDSNSTKSGEVKNSHIFIYETDEGHALETLKHEFIDYAISKVIEPYKEVSNRLIALINDIAYQRKERLVEMVAQLLPTAAGSVSI